MKTKRTAIWILACVMVLFAAFAIGCKGKNDKTAKTVKEITLSDATAEIKAGGAIVYADYTVTANYSDGSNKVVPLTEKMFKAEDLAKFENAGTYEIEVSAFGKTTLLTVTVTNYTFEGVTAADVNVVYDGTAKVPTLDNAPAGATAVWTYYAGTDKTGAVVSEAVNAGTYYAEGVVSLKYYNDATVSANVVIAKKAVNPAELKWENLKRVYTGSAIDANVTASDLPEGVTVSYEGDGKTGTAVGKYTVTLKFDDSLSQNYEMTAETYDVEWEIIAPLDATWFGAENGALCVADFKSDSETSGTLTFNGQTTTYTVAFDDKGNATFSGLNGNVTAISLKGGILRLTAGEKKYLLVNKDDLNTYFAGSEYDMLLAQFRIDLNETDKTLKLVVTTEANGEQEYPLTISAGDSETLAKNVKLSASETLYLDYYYSYGVRINGFENPNGYKSESNYVLATKSAVGDTTVIFDVKSDMTMEKRGNEAGGYVVVDNGELSGVAVKLDGHGSATIVYSDKDKADETATYTITDDIVTVMKGETPVYIGKIGVYTEKGKDYPALRLDVKGTVGAYLDQTDLSVIVLDDNGNATRYSSYGAKEIGYYYMIDDGVFYYADKELTNAYMYVVDGNVVRSSDFFASYYASDFASVVFYTNGIVRYNNNSENDKYYTYDEVTNTGRIYTKAESGDKNRYGYSYEGFSLNKNDKGEYDTLTYNDGNKERTYYYFNRQYITLTDATGDKTLEFQPTGLPTFTVEATLTTKVTTKDENGKEVVKYEKQSYYVILTYDKDGEPHTYLAKGVAGQVNGSIRANNGSYTYVYTEQYDLTADFGAKTFSFTPDTYKRSFRAYDYTYLYLLANGYQLESQYGIMQIVENVEGGVSNYTISGAFKYFPELDAEGKPVKKDNKTVVRDFTFENGKLSKAGYANGRYGHSYVAEFVVDGETYHMTFYLMPSGTFQKGIYAYQIAYVTKVTDKITVDAANDTVYFKEKLIYSGSRVSKGKGEDGAALYYEVGDEFLPSLRYNGEIVNAYFTEFKDGSWHFASQVYNVTSGVDYHYYYTPALDTDNNEIDGGTVLRTRYYYATTGDKDKVYFLVDDDYNVVKVLSVTFSGDEETTAVAGCKKTGENVFEIVAGDKTYVLTFTKGTGEDGATTINVAMTEKAADAENAA